MFASEIQAPALYSETPNSDGTAVGRLVAAILRIRHIDSLEGALATRCWLAADMGVSHPRLNQILEFMFRQGWVDLPDDHLVTIARPDAIRAIALGMPGVGMPSVRCSA